MSHRYPSIVILKELIDDVEAKLDDASHGLAALKDLIDAIESKLDNPSHGLANLKVLIDALEAKLDDHTHGLAALKILIDAIEAKLDHKIYGLMTLRILLDMIEDKLDSPTYGLSTLKTYIDEVESLLKNATYGLSALKTLVDSIEAKLDVPANFMADVSALALEATLNTHDTDIKALLATIAGYIDTEVGAIETKLDSPNNFKADVSGLAPANEYDTQLSTTERASASALTTHDTDIKAKVDRKVSPMLFLSVIDDVIDLPATAADTNLPNVVISGIPDGATLVKVLVFVIIRAIENTSAAGANAIQGAQNIRIKKSTGTWGVDDIIAIPLTDNMWTVAASTREFGDVIGGDDAHDVKSEVDENATYNLRFEDADVDYDNLRLNDVQVMIKVWFK